MSIKIAINGYGRIGRCILRAIYEYHREQDFEIVMINDAAGIHASAHFTQYDSTHGRFPFPVTIHDQHIQIKDHQINIISERDPLRLPWQEYGIDLVFECTGRFTAKEQAMKHITAGAKKVLISAPAEHPDATIVFGVNHHILKNQDQIVSNASCTTNCLAAVVQPLVKQPGIINGLVNTIHAYTKDQMLLDGNHQDLYRARAAAHSIIPTKTGAAKAIGLVIPELTGKLDGFALRVPVINVSALDLSFTAARDTSAEEINYILTQAANDHVLYTNNLPLVSCDFNHHPASAIVDLKQTKVIDRLVKIVAWYDNEWGFANRMLDTALCMFNC